jgi:preprotein translocase subunit SecD
VASPRSTIPNPVRTLTGLFVVLAVLTGIMFAQGRSTPKLGLDLAGGTTVTLTAQTEKGHTPPSSSMDKAVQIINDRVNGLGISSAQVAKQGNDNIVVSIPGANESQALATVGTTAKLQFRGVEAETNGGPVSATAAPSASATPKAGTSGSPKPSASASSSASTGARPSASPKGRALSQALTAPTPNPSASSSAGSSAKPSATPQPASSGSIPSASSLGLPPDVPPAVIKEYMQGDCTKKATRKLPNSDSPTAKYVASCGQDGTVKYLLGPVVVQGEQVSSAQAVPPNPQQGQATWTVQMNFKSKGSSEFYNATKVAYAAHQTNAQSPQSQIAIVLDGDTVSAPSIDNGPISGGTASIYGSAKQFTQSYANNLANVLNYGALPLTFKTSSTQTISSSLGSDQLSGGLLAGAIGLILVVLYSLMYYQGLGIVSVFSLTIAGAITWLSVVILGENVGFRLSLEHIIGLIVSIGITADSFIVYFERLRDELREGRPLRPSVEKAWIRARRTILVADAVTFIAAVILYMLAVGDVAGFAFAMGLTTLIDVVVVFFFTKPMVALLARMTFFNKGHRFSGLSPERLRKTGTVRTAAPTGQEA